MSPACRPTLLALAVISSAVLLALSASATPVIETFAALQTTSANLSDHDGPQVGGVPQLTSSVTHSSAASRCSITGTCAAGQNSSANAISTQRETVFGVFSALQADATFFSGLSNAVSARTTWEESPSVSGPNSITLFIKPGELTIIDFASIVFSHAITARYRIELSVNGNIVFFSEASVSGGPGGLTLTESGTDLGGTLFTDANFPRNVRGYTFDPFITTIDLGNLTTSDVVRYTMEVSVAGPGGEVGGFARVGDPFDLTGSGSSIAFGVPEPSIALMLGVVGAISIAVLRAARAALLGR
jgi:hypothetical protein